MDEDDDLMIGFARVKLKSEQIYDHLSSKQQAYMEAMVEATMTGARGLPHDGAYALLAWLQSNDALDDDAFTYGIAFAAAMERWEQARAGA